MSGHQHRWLTGGYDLEIGHFFGVDSMMVSWWMPFFAQCPISDNVNLCRGGPTIQDPQGYYITKSVHVCSRDGTSTYHNNIASHINQSSLHLLT